MEPETIVIVMCSVLAVLGGEFFLVMVAAGFDFHRLGLARRCFSRVLGSAKPDETAAVLLGTSAPPALQAPKPPKLSGAPLRALAMLQREGRLLDFLLEDIQSYPDAQVGAAVRDIHRKCQHALKEHLVLEPVLPQEEGAAVEVSAGFDPSAVRVVGNVTAAPPYKGTLQHHGWRVKELKLAPPPDGQDELVLQPAEVEVQ